MKNILTLVSMIPGYKSRVVKVVAVNILLGIGAVVTPYIFKNVVDSIVALSSHRISSDAASASIIGSLGLLAFIRVANIILDYAQDRTGDLLYFDTTWRTRKQIFEHLTTLSIDFYEQQRVGELVERVLNATMDLRIFLRMWAEGSLLSVLTIIFILAFLLIRIPLVGLLMAITTPIMIGSAIYRIRQTQPLQREWSKQAEKTVGTFSETISMIATVRSFSQEKAKVKKFARETEEFAATRKKHLRIEWRLNAFQASIIAVAAFIALAIVTLGALKGEYTAGDILLVLTYVQQIVSNIQPIVRLIINTGETEISAERVVELLNTKPTVVDKPNAIQLGSLKTIEFKSVSFTYPGKNNNVLENVSFKLKSGQTLALVGPSGAGKTTVTKLLLRFYEPTSGQILINGQDIAGFSQESIREHVGMVMQDVALFNDTVDANIRFAKPEASEEEVRQAAKTAHADVFIDKLPSGYLTLVGERGIKLSGGEKQRIAIARAMLRNPELAILDEATSALDSESEHYIQDALKRLLKNRTSIIIAHRFSTVRQADIILVLQNGQLVESGTHSELAAEESGLYARLFKLQTEGVLVSH